MKIRCFCKILIVVFLGIWSHNWCKAEFMITCEKVFTKLVLKDDPEYLDLFLTRLKSDVNPRSMAPQLVNLKIIISKVKRFNHPITNKTFQVIRNYVGYHMKKAECKRLYCQLYSDKQSQIKLIRNFFKSFDDFKCYEIITNKYSEKQSLYALYLAVNFLSNAISTSYPNNSYAVMQLNRHALGVASAYCFTKSYEIKYSRNCEFTNGPPICFNFMNKNGLDDIHKSFLNNGFSPCIHKDAVVEFVDKQNMTTVARGQEFPDNLRYGYCLIIADSYFGHEIRPWEESKQPNLLFGYGNLFKILRKAIYYKSKCKTTRWKQDSRPECKIQHSIVTSMTSLRMIAEDVCTNPPNKRNLDAFLCIDIVYIMAILRIGIHFENSIDNIFFSLTINNRSAHPIIGFTLLDAIKKLTVQ